MSNCKRYQDIDVINLFRTLGRGSRQLLFTTLRSGARDSRLSCALTTPRAVAVGKALLLPSILNDSRFVDQEFPVLRRREVLDQRPEKRQVFSYATMRKARPFRFRVTYRLLTIQKRLSIEVRASGTRAGIRMAKAIRSLAGGHGANSNLGNGNLRPETFGENARNCPRESPDRQLRPILIEPSYGNVVLSCAGGNHVGLCRLPGGGRSPEKPVSRRRNPC